jgi:hypothetical protein
MRVLVQDRIKPSGCIGLPGGGGWDNQEIDIIKGNAP